MRSDMRVYSYSLDKQQPHVFHFHLESTDRLVTFASELDVSMQSYPDIMHTTKQQETDDLSWWSGNCSGSGLNK